MADAEQFQYEGLFAKTTPGARDRAVVRRGKYDFAVAYPDPASLPLDELMAALEGALRDEGKDLAVYPHPSGYPPLREFVAGKLARDRGIQVSADDIILADGSSQPIYMLLEVLLDPGDVVLTEEFVYSGTLNTLRRFQADVRGVACDDDGIVPEALEGAIKTAAAQGKRPKFIYTIPSFQNPQGWTMTLERRQALVRLSQRYDVPILEDDCYVDLRYDGEPVTSIHSLDETGRVMYVASFSKNIAPGMRMGYVTAPPEVLDRVAAVKSGSGVNQFAALAVHRYSTSNLEDHIGDIRHILRAKRDAMLAALGENFGSAATWSRPEGGLYVWLRMPEGVDLASVREKALEAGVGYQAGNLYAPDGVSGKNYARLCFGYNTPEEIHEGIALLARIFEDEGILKS
ncbi:MAG: PLP-dependent aminotransferase family protein [SAR202 cluster bacterium]|nr:PLP-dependent aminotransferase family protein [SAR202 cluster bacterium]